VKTVASGLNAWLNSRSGQLPEKGERQILATQIGVTLEALCQELANRS